MNRNRKIKALERLDPSGAENYQEKREENKRLSVID